MPKKGYTRDLDQFTYHVWDGRKYCFPNRERYTYSSYYRGYHRQIRTHNERRQNYGHEAEGILVRRRRLGPLPTNNDDLSRSRSFGKSWKDYTKRRKQWERW